MNAAPTLLLAVALVASPSTFAEGARTVVGKERPVMKIVRLLQDMQAELEKENADDEGVYKSVTCWCKENDVEKTQAIERGKGLMDDLKAALGTYAGKIEEMRQGLADTKGQLQQDQKALSSAQAVRTQESQAFHAEEKELLDTIRACKQATVVLSRHNPSLAQLQAVAKSLQGLNTLNLAKNTLGRDKLAVLQAFVQQAEDVSSTGSLRRIPGFQSYTPQSGQISGILKRMQEEFEGMLAKAREEEQKAQEEYAALKAAKEAELEVGRKKQMQLEQDDALAREKNAAAYQELNDVREQVEVDGAFLANLKRRCAETDEEYQARRHGRSEELAAVQDTIAFLNSDEAFDVFDRTVNGPASFLQAGSAVAPSSAERVLRSKATQALRGTGSAKLAMLAASVQLDAFVQVKAAIDKMVAELDAQQQDEVQHRDWCTDELARNKRSTREQSDKKEDLEADIASLKRSIEDQSNEIDHKNAAIVEMQKEMKKASDIREGEYADFQETVNDQRISQTVLQKALDRMKQIYALVQLKQPGAPHVQLSGNATGAGNGPARFAEYGKSAKGSRVVVMLEQIFTDCKQMEAESLKAEQDAQASYEGFMKDSNDSIKRYQRNVVNLSEGRARAEQALAMAEDGLDGTVKELEGLHGILINLNGSCDFLLKNFDARQEARATEIAALKEAKAILSGMN